MAAHMHQDVLEALYRGVRNTALMHAAQPVVAHSTFGFKLPQPLVSRVEADMGTNGSNHLGDGVYMGFSRQKVRHESEAPGKDILNIILLLKYAFQALDQD